MPIHDWTRVPAGIFHHFHGTWLFELAGELNEGVLPSGYYALGEQIVTGAVPDVLTQESRFDASRPSAQEDASRPLPAPPARLPHHVRQALDR